MSRRPHSRVSSSDGSDPPSPKLVTPPRELEYLIVELDSNDFGAWCVIHSRISKHFFWSEDGDVIPCLNPDTESEKHYVIKILDRTDRKGDVWYEKVVMMNDFVKSTSKSSVMTGGSPEECLEMLEEKMRDDYPHNFLDWNDRALLLRYYRDTTDFGYPPDGDELNEARIETEDSTEGEGAEPGAKKPRGE